MVVRRRSRGALVLLLVGLFTVYGTATSWAKPLSEKQWAKQANAICRAFKTDRLAILPVSGGSILASRKLDEAQRYVDQAAPLYERLITSLDSLQEPTSRAKNVKKFVTELAAAVKAIRSDPMSAFAAFDSPFEKTYAALKPLKLTYCDGLADQRF